MPKIGIAITTRNRIDVLRTSLDRVRRMSPPDSIIVIVDDASDAPVEEPELGYRFEQNVGIAVAKNKCLELLYDAGCQHLFLFDDDSYPVVNDWWVPYVESDEPHLMSVFLSKNRPWTEVIYEDSKIRALSRPMGYMLYAHRSVLDTVGGMDPEFGIWGFEHVSWSNRIHAAKLTMFRFADVVADRKLIHCMDELREVQRTVSQQIRNQGDQKGFELNQRYLDDPRYIEFRR